MSQVKLVINGTEVEVPQGSTVLQAAQTLGVEVPVFCYHEKLSVAGNCRMCLVEMEKFPKPIASCAMPVSEGMVIHTNSPMVEKARKGVLELLLINHPLDCPICDQGGECDLQDITMNYGPDSSRFKENKRAVEDKDLGPLIKTTMTRCIHCTRCVRFATEVAGVPELGALGRGEHVEISPYIEGALTSELSGNMVDICPVGALTSKPYAFRARPWELSHVDSIDVMDAMGSNIRVDYKPTQVMRILPRINDEINEEWITDKARHSVDGLRCQRLDQPYVRGKGKLTPTSWEDALKAASKALTSVKPQEVGMLSGDFTDCETLLLGKELMAALGSPHLDCGAEGVPHKAPRCSYILNTPIHRFEEADVCLMIGTFPRWEAPLLNARLRKAYLNHSFKAAYIGGTPPSDFTYPVENLGTDPKVLHDILAGKGEFSKALKKATNPLILVGQDAMSRIDSPHLMHILSEISKTYKVVREGWNGFNVLQKTASRVGALDLGFRPGPKGYSQKEMIAAFEQGKLKVLYLLGADELTITKPKEGIIIYQGSHGDRGAELADIILPGCAYTEKSGTYVNAEGRPQQTQRAIFPPNLARNDWKILKALGDSLGYDLPYLNIQDVREKMAETSEVFKTMNQILPSPWENLGVPGELRSEPFTQSQSNYYMTDSLSRHSPTMAKCVEALKGGTND